MGDEMAFFLDPARRGPLEPYEGSRHLQVSRQGWLVWAVTLVRLRRKWAADQRALRGMDAHLRRDIGVTNGALQYELRRSFWGDPAVRRVRPGWPLNRGR
jgi:uncharacterized protein YjiS (DUF1127 family)